MRSRVYVERVWPPLISIVVRFIVFRIILFHLLPPRHWSAPTASASLHFSILLHPHTRPQIQETRGFAGGRFSDRDLRRDRIFSMSASSDLTTRNLTID